MSKNKEAEFIELLSEEEICELHEAFNIFDFESDGSIEAKKLIFLMKALKQNPTQKEIDDILLEFKIDKDGQIYFNQFLKIMAKRLKNIKEDEDKYLKNLFSNLDRNNNGLIVTHSKENISENDIETIMTEADTDGDGLISFEEFMMIMKN